MRTNVIAGICYAALTLVLYPIPLFNILHAESMLVVALAGFFLAGMAALVHFRGQRSAGYALSTQLGLLCIPLFLLTATLAYIPNCGYFQGLLFFFLFPVISVTLAVCLAYAIHNSPLRRKFASFLSVGVILLTVPTAYDLLLHPQQYVYNHVFGGILGPIYDEELAIRPGLFAFRAMTLLWAGLFFVIGYRFRYGTSARPATAIGGVLTLILGVAYLFSAQLGINTPAWYIQKQLGGFHQTENFDIYYNPEKLSESEILYMGLEHEFRYAQIRHLLDEDVSDRIETYIYPDPDTKARLTGARETSVAPVWLRTPQIHMLADRFERSFAHELVHVFSREFGLPVINASVSVGLVEGLAVAVAPSLGSPAPHELVAAAIRYDDSGERYLDDLVRAVTESLSARGFWGGRSAVSYSTMGSFVRYLLDTRGPEPFKRAYALAGFEDAYGKPVEELAEEWREFLMDQGVSDLARTVMLARFSAPSLFETRCPHYVPRYERLYREGAALLAAGDTTAAIDRMEAALERRPDFPPALALWADVKLARGDHNLVLRRLHDDAVGESLALRRRASDASAMAGDLQRARAGYREVLDRLPQQAREERAALTCRRELLDQPELIGLLNSNTGSAVKAETLLHAGSSRCARLLAALELASDHRYEQALRVLDGVSRRWESTRMALQIHYWRAEFALRMGDIIRARKTANSLPRDYCALGDEPRARQSVDFLQKVNWIESGRIVDASFVTCQEVKKFELANIISGSE